jgi:hypothetical protein
MCYSESGQCVNNRLNICLILKDDCQPNQQKLPIENCIENCRRDKEAFFGALNPAQRLI